MPQTTTNITIEMLGLEVRTTFSLLVLCFSLTSASFFGYPRIHFNGLFKADVSTGNNKDVNYFFAKYSSDNLIYPSWNPNGTGEFSFVNCSVTAVVNENGTIITNSTEDAIIGLPIVSNPSMVPAKLVDLDSPHYDLSSTIYGMKFGVNWKPNSNNSFIGEWVPATVSRDLWGRQIKNKHSDPLVQPIATQGSSRLVNVTWGNIENSPILKLLQKDSKTKLSVSVSLYLYTRPGQDVKFTYGKVSGTIGFCNDEEPLNFVGDRVLKYNENFQGNSMTLPRPDGNANPCEKESPWMSTAYFNINTEPKLVATVDFGNSIKIDPQGELCKFGHLYFAVRVKLVPETFQVIGKIDYQNRTWYNNTAGLNDFPLHGNAQVKYGNSSFAVVWSENTTEVLHLDGNYAVCKSSSSSPSSSSSSPSSSSSDPSSPSSSSSSSKDSDCVHVVMEESRFNLRPMDHHVYRLEAGNDKEGTAVLRLRLRDYGKKPSIHQSVKLIKISDSPKTEWNKDHLIVDTNPKPTDDDGIAIFNFTADTSIGQPRKQLEMDGQVFTLGYCVMNGEDEDTCEKTYTNRISFLVWNKMEYNEPVFWEDHIRPIFVQYERLYPAMRHVLRLGEYEDIVKYQNLQLLQKAMDGDNFKHASYMPVSRDLSPSRRDMILKWLKSPDHYRNWSHVQEVHYTPPEFCKDTNYEFDKKGAKVTVADGLKTKATQLSKEMSLRGDELLMNRFKLLSGVKSGIPLWFAHARENKNCNVTMLKEYLQEAVMLEFATIPPYLTAMYSIKAGENRQVYDVIRSVVMQEMLHMAQAANILIALGGRPIIDDVNCVPSYPGNLPAHVLPGLNVTLKKASPKHIYEVFMMIEYPHGEKDSGLEEDVGDQLTIGNFYKRIEKCIKDVGDGVFCENDPVITCKKKQLVWPWNVEHSSDALHTVTDVKSALNAINVIVEQGEGAEKQDPTYLDTKWLAHFYKFEELACKKHLCVKHKHHHSENVGFSDKENIEFTAEGVWPMRDNPSKEGIPYGTQAYHKARHFHEIYRSFLAKLQEVFDGKPDSIDDAVYLMESLQLHMKELMMLEIPSPPGWPKHTCGPVFDYEWE